MAEIDYNQDHTSTNEQLSNTTSTVPEPGASFQPTPTPTPQLNNPLQQPAATMPNKNGKRFRLPRPEQLLPGFLRRKLGRYARFTSIVLILILVGGSASAAFLWTHPKSQKQPVARFAAIVQPFRVVSTLPARDAEDVIEAGKITIKFNRAVDATKLNGDFFVTPKVDGTYSQGATNDEAVFTPNTPFPQGTAVEAMIHGEFQSQDGSQLGADYSFGFTTSVPSNEVLFQREGLIETLGSAPASQEQSYILAVGKDVDPEGKVVIYRSDVPALLDSLVYTDKTSDGYTNEDFVNQNISTDGLKKITSQNGLKDNSTFKLTEPNGVYALVATAGGKQVGYAWLVVSDFGVVLRQDDQQVVLAAQDYQTSQPVKADVIIYSLKDSKRQLAQTTVDGMASVDIPFSQRADLVVATLGDDTAVIPVSSPLSLADVRVQHDLSTMQTVFGLTDKPTYNVGDTVRYGGFARTDNDAQYTITSGARLKLYVAMFPGDTHLADFSSTVNASGQIKGTFTAKSKYIPDGQTSQQLHIYAISGDESSYTDQPIASFTVTKSEASAYNIVVRFDKNNYLASDKISATISATKSDGSALANAKVLVDIYSKQYYENDPASNQASLDSVGSKINSKPIKVSLDANGNGTLSVDVSKLPDDGTSQTVTVQANKADTSGVVAAGGASAIIHQGDGTLEFGPTRTVVKPGGTLVARVYAKTLANQGLANATIQYSLTASTYNDSTNEYGDQQIATGNVKADASGYAEINQPIGAYDSSTSLSLDVWTSDAQNNKIEATDYYYIQTPEDNTVYSDLQLSGLDVSGAAKDASVGQTLNLVIDSPSAVHALVTLERGRIHKFEVIDLKQGKNTYSIQITADLAPSFSLAFSYFTNGSYQVDGITFSVTPSDKLTTLQLTPDKQAYGVGNTATIKIDAKDSTAKPLQTSLVLGIVDAKMFNLYDQVVPDIFAYMYSPREITTNSSSSLTSIGSGGGGCGGGWGDQPELMSPPGNALLWEPSLTTDAAGSASVKVKLPKGTWRVYAYSMSSDTIVGSSNTTITAN